LIASISDEIGTLTSGGRQDHVRALGSGGDGSDPSSVTLEDTSELKNFGRHCVMIDDESNSTMTDGRLAVLREKREEKLEKNFLSL